MSFKERIKQRRLELGLTLAEVGEIVGVSKTTIQRWESGAIENQRRDKIELLAKALQITPGELMGWDDELLLEIREETQSGRMAAKEEMYRTFGVEQSASDLRVIGDKTVLLYYKAFERHSAPELWDLIRTVDDLDHRDLDNIRMMVRAYLKADPTIKEIVDTALKPYKEKESLDALIG